MRPGGRRGTRTGMPPRPLAPGGPVYPKPFGPCGWRSPTGQTEPTRPGGTGDTGPPYTAPPGPSASRPRLGRNDQRSCRLNSRPCVRSVGTRPRAVPAPVEVVPGPGPDPLPFPLLLRPPFSLPPGARARGLKPGLGPGAWGPVPWHPGPGAARSPGPPSGPRAAAKGPGPGPGGNRVQGPGMKHW